jgi:hypothetical protein
MGYYRKWDMQIPSKNSDTLKLFYLLGDYYEDYEAAKQLGDATSGELMALENHPMDIPRRFMVHSFGVGSNSCRPNKLLRNNGTQGLKVQSVFPFLFRQTYVIICIHIYHSWRDIPIYLLLLVRTCPECCWNPHELLAFIHDFSY